MLLIWSVNNINGSETLIGSYEGQIQQIIKSKIDSKEISAKVIVDEPTFKKYEILSNFMICSGWSKIYVHKGSMISIDDIVRIWQHLIDCEFTLRLMA